MKTMKRTVSAFGIAVCAGTLMGAALAAAPKAEMDKVPLTLRGCIVAGEVKDSYLLKDTEVDPAGTAPANAFYRFSSTNGLGSQVGYRVEIKGVADLADPDKGKLKVTARDGKMKTKVDSEESMVMANEKNVWFGSAGSAKLKADIVTYKFDIQHVQRIPGGTCAATK
jgi:hypothetical protein